MPKATNVSESLSEPLSEIKQKIFNFIISTFTDDDDFDRAKSLGDRMDQYRSYGDFVKGQENEVRKLNKRKVRYAKSLMRMINREELILMDKEYMGGFESSGFMILNGIFVAFNER